MNRQFATHVEDALKEAWGNIPETKRSPARPPGLSFFNMFDMGFGDDEPVGVEGTQVLRTPYKETRERAWQARRNGAKSIAQAIEWAYDSLINGRGYVRVGEVYTEESYDTTGLIRLTAGIGEGPTQVKKYAALVRERSEDE